MITQNGVSPVQSVDPASLIFGPYTTAEATNPSDEATVVETPALPAGPYEVLVTPGASAAADFGLEQRNLANDGIIGTRIVIKAAAGQSGQYRFFFNIAEGQRMRLVMDDALTGSEAGVLNLRRLP